MHRLMVAVVTVAALIAGCDDSKQKPQKPARAELRKLTGNTIEIVPLDGQLPYCLVYSITEAGKPPTIRQLTMTHENKSVACEAGKPIGGISNRIPVEEGKVRLLVFFSDRKLNAGSVAQQIYELSATNPRFLTLDLRLPGEVYVETLEFDPQPGTEPVAGAVVGGETGGGETGAGETGAGETGGGETAAGSETAAASAQQDAGTP